MIAAPAVVLFLFAAPPASPAPKVATEVVATVDGEPFTVRELEQAAGSRLFVIRTQQYQAQRQILEEAIGKRLLEKEAAARKTTVDDLLKQEVEAKVPPVTEDEQKQFYAQNKARFGNATEPDALAQIAQGLRQQRTRDRQAELVGELRKKARVRILLEAPRAQVEVGDNPARGPANAPVTIVEFSDFQCPYCSRATATLKKLEETYPGKIRLVFRDFPLVQIHPQAAKAAEAAGCADEQGRFWPLHDAMFSHQDKLQVADLKQYAVDLGLDAAKFNECLDSGRRAAEWKTDQSAGERYGVQSTPAFFINGRLVVGAQPYDQFVQIVEEELARGGQAPTAKASGP
jgi:protein-disulfide isomerase